MYHSFMQKCLKVKLDMKTPDVDVQNPQQNLFLNINLLYMLKNFLFKDFSVTFEFSLRSNYLISILSISSMPSTTLLLLT